MKLVHVSDMTKFFFYHFMWLNDLYVLLKQFQTVSRHRLSFAVEWNYIHFNQVSYMWILKCLGLMYMIHLYFICLGKYWVAWGIISPVGHACKRKKDQIEAFHQVETARIATERATWIIVNDNKGPQSLSCTCYLRIERSCEMCENANFWMHLAHPAVE